MLLHFLPLFLLFLDVFVVLVVDVASFVVDTFVASSFVVVVPSSWFVASSLIVVPLQFVASSSFVVVAFASHHVDLAYYLYAF